MVTALLGLNCLTACSSLASFPSPGKGSPPAVSESASHYSYRVVRSYPHDDAAFTQGLVYENGFLYEGTGLYGRSTLRRVRLESGEVSPIYRLPNRYFGEGVSVWGDKIIQLTWRSNVGFVYDKESFELLEEFSYLTEGWGLTHDGERLILSDGTATLYFLDPDSFEEVGRLDVWDENGPVSRINELEYVKGEVYANVWRTDYLARISPRTGQVAGWIDLSGLLSDEERGRQADGLNGIAYDAEGDRLFVTGKWWPRFFEIEIVPSGN
jgi:glutamine cyclotransferase